MSVFVGENKTNVIPTFLLRKIDHLSVVSKYFDGYYKDIEAPKKTKITSSTVIIESNIGTNHQSEIYEYLDYYNARRRLLTTNHPNYIVAKQLINDQAKTQEGSRLQEQGSKIQEGSKSLDPSEACMRQITDLPNTRPCIWCRRIKPNAGTIPQTMIEDTRNNLYIFQGSLTAHSLNCALAYCEYKQSVPWNMRDYNLSEAAKLVRFLFDLMHPGKRLKAALSWELLDYNGGPLTEEEYDQNTYNFIKTPNIVLLPFKEIWVNRTNER